MNGDVLRSAWKTPLSKVVRRLPLSSVKSPRGKSPALQAVFARSKQNGLADEPDGAVLLQVQGTPCKTVETVSPSLALLRQTPGLLREKRRVLEVKHDAARKNVDKLAVGGGVSMWPGMVDMRLNPREMGILATQCGVLMFVTALVLHLLHGGLLERLWSFTLAAKNFKRNRKLDVTSQATVDESVRQWSSGMLKLEDEISASFDVRGWAWSYWGAALAYVTSVCLLLALLVDSIRSPNRLSPRRIRVWALLLSCVAVGTVYCVVLVGAGLALEAARDDSLHALAHRITIQQSEPDVSLDLSVCMQVLTTWRIRRFSPSSPHVLHVLGLMPLRDLATWLSYYSWPVITALLTPVIQLLASFWRVHAGSRFSDSKKMKSFSELQGSR